MSSKLFWSVAIVSIFAAPLSARAVELARVNGSAISLEDFEKKYKENLKFFQFKAPTRKAVLDELIKREVALQEAKKMGLEKDADVQDRLATVLYHAFLERRLSKEFEQIKVSDDDARSFYAKNPEIRTSHIFVGVRPDATPEQAKLALDKIKKIQAEALKPGKMTFSEVAQKFSEGPNAAVGGDIDFQTRDKLDPAYYEAAVALKTPGRVSEIVRSQFGYHIIKLTAIRGWEEADRAMVKRMVFDERRGKIFERFMTQLKGQAKISVKNELLKD